MDGQDEPAVEAPKPAADNFQSGGNSAGRHFAWAGAAALVAVCGLAGFVLYQCSPGAQVQRGAQAVNQLAGTVFNGTERLVAAIQREEIIHTFRQHLDTFKPDPTGRLLVAEVKANEQFSAADVSWRGTTTSDIRVPVTYEYFVALNDPWQLAVRVAADGVVTAEVIAPALQALPDPSPNTSQMEIKSENGWLRWNKNDVQSNLLKEMTPRLNERAVKMLPQYFPVARPAVEKFVRDWLLREYQIPAQTPVFLKVTFRNETPAPGPTLAPVQTPAPKG